MTTAPKAPATGRRVNPTGRLILPATAARADALAPYFARTPGKEHLADGVRPERPLIPYQTSTEEATA